MPRAAILRILSGRRSPSIGGTLNLACARFLASLVVLLASLNTIAFAAEPESGQAIEEMIVSGSRVPQSQTTISQSVSVLEGADLDSSISLTLDDALRFVPGLQVTRDGARGGRTQISLRGLDPNHVVVLIDGVRLNDPTNSRGGSFDPTSLALLDIERVEIVRGPLSAVYGSDALAGVINIITKRVAPTDPVEASVRIRGGRFHTGNAIAQASAGLGKTAGLSLGAALDTFRDPNSDGGYDGANLKAKLDLAIPGGGEAESFFRIHRGSARGFPESSGGPEQAVLRTMEDRNIREILVGTAFEIPVRDFGSVEVRASHTSRREDLDSPGIDVIPPLSPSVDFDVPQTHSGDEYARWDVALISRFELPDLETEIAHFGTRIVLGSDFADEDGESDAFQFELFGVGTGFAHRPFYDHRQTVGIFGEIEESIGEYVTLSTSLRYDTTPDEEDRFSPAAGLSIKIPRTTLVAFGNYSEGFKRPSFFALGNPSIGNPSLRVEKSRGWEVGVRATALEGRLRGQLNYFEVEVKNLIDFDSATFTLVNRSRLVSRGNEFEFGWQALEWLDLRGGVTFNHTNFAGGGPDPTNRPVWRGYAEFAVEPVQTVELSVRLLAVGSVKATSFRTRSSVSTLSGYERVDVRAAWSPVDWIDLFVEIENLTDRTYRESIGFESPGIAPRAGVTFRM